MEEIIKDAVSERFSQVMKVLNKNQREIAEDLEIHKGSVSYIVNGRDNIKATLLHKMFVVYGVNPPWMTNGIGEMIITNRDEEVKGFILGEEKQDYQTKNNSSNHYEDEIAYLREQVKMLNKLVEAHERNLEDLRAVVRHYQQMDSDSSEEDLPGDVSLAG